MDVLLVAIKPPSPVVIVLLPKKLNTATSPSDPTILLLYVAPCASAASSITFKSCSFAILFFFIKKLNEPHTDEMSSSNLFEIL